jgi:hypothetical protein
MPINCFIPSITIDDKHNQQLSLISGKTIESMSIDVVKSLVAYTVCLNVDQDPPRTIRVNNSKFPAIEKFIKDQIQSDNPKLPYLIKNIKGILEQSNGGKLPVGWKISKIMLTPMVGNIRDKYCKKECNGQQTPPANDVADIQQWNNFFIDDNVDLSKLLEEGAQVIKNPDAPLDELIQKPITEIKEKISIANLKIKSPCHSSIGDVTIITSIPVSDKFLIEPTDLHDKIAKSNIDVEPNPKENNIYKSKYKSILGTGSSGSDLTYKLKVFNNKNLEIGLEKTHICNNTYLNLPGGSAEAFNEQDKVKGASNIKNNISSRIVTPETINIKLNNGAYNEELSQILIFAYGDTIWKDNNKAANMMLSLPKKIRIQQPSSILRIPLKIDIDALVKINITKLSLPLVKKGFNVGKNPFEQDKPCFDQGAGTVEIIDKSKNEKIKLSETKIKLSTTVFVDYALDIKKSKIETVPPKQPASYYGKNPSFNNFQTQPLGSLRTQVGLMRFRNESAQISKEIFAQILLDYAGPPVGYYFIDNNLIFNNPDSYWITFEDDIIQKIPINTRASSLFDHAELQGKTIDEIRSIIITKADISPRYIAIIPAANNKKSGAWNLPINRDKTPLLGEPGYETDTGKLKIGDGTSTWGDLTVAFTGYVDDIPKDVWNNLNPLYQKQSIFFIGTRPQLQYFVDTNYYANNIQPDIHIDILLQNLEIPNPPAVGQRLTITGSKNDFPYGALSHNRPPLGGENKTNPFDNLTDQIIEYEQNNIFLSLTEQIVYNFKHANKFTIDDPSGKNFADILGRSFNLEQKYKDKIINKLEEKVSKKDGDCCCYEYTIGRLIDGEIVTTIPSDNIEFDLEVEYIDSTKNKKLLK